MIEYCVIVSASTLPRQQNWDSCPFPLTLQLQSPASLESVRRWIAANHDELDAQVSRHGAILFREFPVWDAVDFDAFVSAFAYPNFAYEQSLSNAVRISKTERVFTANEAPPSVRIFFHHEMAQTPIYPSKLFFFCEQPAEQGGATPICRSDILLDQLRAACPQFVRDCEVKGLRYSNVMPAENDLNSGMGRSWQSTFRANSRAEVEQRLRQLGYSWQWQEDGCLRATTPVLPAVRSIADGRQTFFNQLIAAYRGWQDTRNDPSKAITFGDGTPLDAEAVGIAAKIADELTFNIPWQQGDVCLLDNFIVMHGRQTFSGTRKVLASLVAISDD